MTHASLFSGIGGFDLAAEWAGWTNMFNCEIDGFCRRVLQYHFPNARQYADIRTTDFTVWRGRIDVLTGGFPCQPFSVAGKRLGTDDERHLWPEMLRAIREIRPRWVVGENVFGIVNWSKGLVFEQVCADLENEGYAVQPFILPACAVDAPHRRDRVWVVAHRNDAGSENSREERFRTDSHNDASDAARFGCQPGRSESDGAVQDAQIRADLYVTSKRFGSERTFADAECLGGREICGNFQSAQPNGTRFDGDGDEQPVADADSIRLSIAGQTRHGCSGFTDDRIIQNWEKFPTVSPICSGNDGLSAGLDGITFPAWRQRSIKAYGNAVVPQVVYRIFDTINEYEKYGNDSKTDRNSH